MEKHGISKAALAKIASVRPSAVTKWANGGSIRIAQLSKIAEYFGVDMETAKRLCGHTQDETSRHYDHAAHIEEYRSAIAAAAK